jgi:hypothetical protein
MEPGSLIMERKMLLGIKCRAEHLARQQAESPSDHNGHADMAATNGATALEHR